MQIGGLLLNLLQVCENIPRLRPCRKKKENMLSGDLLNDLRKGHVHFEPSGSEESVEAVVEDGLMHEMDEDHIFCLVKSK